MGLEIKASLARFCGMPWPIILGLSIAGDQSSSPWVRLWAVAPDGCYWRGLRAITSSLINGHPTIVTLWRAGHRFWRSICTSTRITWTSAPRLRATWMSLCKRFAGTMRNACTFSWLINGDGALERGKEDITCDLFTY